MKTTPVTHEDLIRSVLAVPPLARHADLTLNRAENKKQIAHLEQGGVRTLMYGGNANFYNIAVSEYAEVLDFLEQTAGPDTWVIPSAGPDYGKMMDQAKILRERKFPAPMVLPLTFPSTDEGATDGIRRFSDAVKRQVIVYIKSTNFLQPESVGALVREGRVAAIKYAAVLDNPAKDEFLTRLLQQVDKRIVISGIGERPAIQAGRFDEAERIRAAYMPLEDCRDELSPIRVLHDAVTAAGIADMGPMLPMLSRLDVQHRARVAKAASALLAHDNALRSAQ
jgi:dihydrodipicolinate synthase/N-acetylneuraminate lyase